MKDYDVLIHPLSTEKSVRLMESQNKLTFVVDKRADKKAIKRAVESFFNVKVKDVNVHIRNGKKIAIITLHPNFNAMDVATQIGIL